MMVRSTQPNLAILAEVEGLVQILAGGQGAFQLDVDHVHMVGQLQQLVQGGDGGAGEFRVEFHAEIEGF